MKIAVTGKIESAGGTPQITIKSTTQILPRTALQIQLLSVAPTIKNSKGDIDGAIADLDKAIEHQPARRDEACQHLAKLKEQKGDWPGALAAYERLIGFDPNNSSSYYVRATAKKQHGDFEGAMADFTRAAELRSDPAGFTSIGDMRKERGDIAGANAEYDRAIALCDRQIAGTVTSPLDRRSVPILILVAATPRELKGELYRQYCLHPAITSIPFVPPGLWRRGERRRWATGGSNRGLRTQGQNDSMLRLQEKAESSESRSQVGPKKIVVTQPSTQAARTNNLLTNSKVILPNLSRRHLSRHTQERMLTRSLTFTQIVWIIRIAA